MPELPKSGDGGSPGTKYNLRLKEHTMRHPESSNSRPEMPPQAARGRSRSASGAEPNVHLAYTALFGTPARRTQEDAFFDGYQAGLDLLAQHEERMSIALKGLRHALRDGRERISALREVSR